MTTVTVTAAAKDFTGTLRRMTAEHQAVIVKRGCKTVAVMFPPDMIAQLEDLEDIREADRARAEYKKNSSTTIPWEQVKREAGLV